MSPETNTDPNNQPDMSRPPLDDGTLYPGHSLISDADDPFRSSIPNVADTPPIAPLPRMEDDTDIQPAVSPGFSDAPLNPGQERAEARAARKKERADARAEKLEKRLAFRTYLGQIANKEEVTVDPGFSRTRRQRRMEDRATRAGMKLDKKNKAASQARVMYSQERVDRRRTSNARRMQSTNARQESPSPVYFEQTKWERKADRRVSLAKFESSLFEPSSRLESRLDRAYRVQEARDNEALHTPAELAESMTIAGYLSGRETLSRTESEEHIDMILNSPEGVDIIDSVKELFAKHGETAVKDTAVRLRDTMIDILSELGIDASAFTRSPAWALQEMALANYYREDLGPDIDPDDTNGDPMISPEAQENILYEHLGWEVYQNFHGKPQEELADRFFGDNFLTIVDYLNRDPQASSMTLSQRELAELGQLVDVNP